MTFLAKWVFDAFSIDTTEVERTHDALGAVLQQIGVAVFAQTPQEVSEALPERWRSYVEGDFES